MKDQNRLLERYFKLINQIEEIAKNCGRNPQEVSLVIVTKNHPWSEIQHFYNAGHRVFAESRLQELELKAAEAPKDVTWHFIGRLQKNKVRKVIALASLIHSVDSIELAKKISQCSLEASATTKILLQVNISGETSKQGMNIEECKRACDEILSLPSISIEGLMTMAPMTEEIGIIHNCFANLRELRETLRKRYGVSTFPHLSMGMSHDYPIAIAEGATLLRIGSAIFTP